MPPYPKLSVVPNKPQGGFNYPIGSTYTSSTKPNVLPQYSSTPATKVAQTTPQTLGQLAKFPTDKAPVNNLPASQTAAPISAFQPSAVSTNGSWPGSPSSQPTLGGGGAGNKGLFGYLIEMLSGSYAGMSEEQKKAFAQKANLETGLSSGKNAIFANPIPLEFQQGRAAALERDYAPRLTAASSMLEQANKQREMELDALKTAAGLSAPREMAFTSQLVDPNTGEAITGTNPIQQSVSTYAQQVATGQMTFADASSALGNNPYFVAQLNQQVQNFNPAFNVSSSNTLGGQTYQSLINSFNTTKTHLEDLLSSVKNLPLTSFPVINAALNGVQSAIGSKEFQDYQTKLGVARGEIAMVLGGGVATDKSRSEAEAILPSNLGPDQLEAAIKAAQQLMQEKINAYGSLGGGQTSIQTFQPQPPSNSVGWF